MGEIQGVTCAKQKTSIDKATFSDALLVILTNAQLALQQFATMNLIEEE